MDLGTGGYIWRQNSAYAANRHKTEAEIGSQETEEKKMARIEKKKFQERPNFGAGE